ncbi:calcium/sodium antiporter [Methanocella sp. MCL-LM]|uniref:calcium/sodium antiporter n=1 Tax=Methanocella sp. MCL-LM TaxID=3412035 RepID=UPI003C725593
MLLELIGLIAGLALLAKGADWLVDSARDLAFAAGIPASVVGLTLVAMGTSVPELVVGVDSSLMGVGQIAIGNVIGANIANLCLIIGVAAIASPVVISRYIARVDLPVTFGITLIFLIASLDGTIGPVDGALLLGAGILYLFSIYRRAGRDRKALVADTDTLKNLVLLIAGIACVILGGKVTVDSAISLAVTFGISPFLIALTVIAIGTSMPEMVTAIIASRKGEGDLVLGNCIGSVIVNTLFVLGTAAIIRPLPVSGVLDILLLLGAIVLLLPILLTRSQVSHREGLFLIAVYVLFVGYKVIAGVS